MLVVTADLERVSRTHRVFAALTDSVLLSASVLKGEPGFKISFRMGVEEKVRVSATDGFKEEWPCLTLVIRDAISKGKGWKAVTLQEATQKDGYKWGLVLRGNRDPQPASSRCKRLLSLTGNDFVQWASQQFMLEMQSAWVQ